MKLGRLAIMDERNVVFPVTRKKRWRLCFNPFQLSLITIISYDLYQKNPSFYFVLWIQGYTVRSQIKTYVRVETFSIPIPNNIRHITNNIFSKI